MKPNVLEFSDYRSFLLASYESRRRSHRHFSLAAWARKLSLKSSSTLIMILKGDRNPSEQLVDTLNFDLGLCDDEAEYFRNLVQLEKAKTNTHLKNLILEKLPKSNHPNAQLIKMKYFRLVSQWYFFAIRELVDLEDFQEDGHWIQDRLLFHVSIRRITEALEVLLECGLLTRNSEGQLKYTSSVITTFDIPDDDIRRYHKTGFDLCAKAVDIVPVESREMFNSTFTCREEDLPEIKKRIRSVLHNLVQFSDGKSDSVYMLQIGCIPLTKNSQKSREGHDL